MAIKRLWYCWTLPENADKYQGLLHGVVFPDIEIQKIAGFRSIELLRRDLSDEVEFVTIMTFNSLQNIIDFKGEDYMRSHVPAVAKLVLKRWNPVSIHYETIE